MKLLSLAALLSAAAFSPDGQQRLLPVDERGYQKILAANAGKVILVDFWATWCAPCLDDMPAVGRLEAKYQHKGFKLITVSCDEPEQEAAAHRFLEKNGVPLPAYIMRVENDERFITAIDRKWSGALPARFLYGRDGRKVKAFIGETQIGELEAAIKKGTDAFFPRK